MPTLHQIRTHPTAAQKVCSRCRDSLPVALFSLNRGKKDGLNNYCKPCARAYRTADRVVRQSDPAVGIDQKRCVACRGVFGKDKFNRNKAMRDGLNSYCRPCHRASVVEWRIRNPEIRRAQSRRASRALRVEVLVAYGGACKCCGEATPEFLAVDHVNNDGAEHRRSIGGDFYTWLRRHGFPRDGFQLLCHNCNSAKGLYGACPHAAFNALAVTA